MVNLRIRLMKTSRTDVMCVACARFHADHVIVRTDGTETDTGVHAKCAEEIKTRFTRKKKEPPASHIERDVLVRLRSGT